MNIITNMQNYFMESGLSPLLIVGFMTVIGLYAGKSMKFIKLPSIIGFMLIGVLLGPSLFNILHEEFKVNLSFITDIALSFVAVSIGIELSFADLKKQGKGIIVVIAAESFLAFMLVTGALYLLTKDIALSLIFGSIAPASAPAGTVAIIQEYKAKGSLTKALYAVVGFDDGLGIIIFGFASAISRSILGIEAGMESESWYLLILEPLKEIALSLAVGGVVAFVFCLLARKLSQARDIFILIFATILISAGLCNLLHLSIILTNMIVGIVIVNTQQKNLVQKIHHELSEFMPILFIMFFILAGANLHVAALPSLGLLGIVYIAARTTGLMTGASLGSIAGGLEPKIRKYLGMGILSQAGVAIGLSLVVKNEFTSISAHGAEIGNIVITTITATCIFFEIIGPILTKIGLEKSGEITVHKM
ncbi:MAG: cation:proton antiporter [Spirochaetia bacterium]|nr:cation:proton antiporter [Spirochaetia bacterium]